VHSVAVPQKVEEYFSNSEVAKLCLSDGELSALIGFISRSFLEIKVAIYWNFKKGYMEIANSIVVSVIST